MRAINSKISLLRSPPNKTLNNAPLPRIAPPITKSHGAPPNTRIKEITMLNTAIRKTLMEDCFLLSPSLPATIDAIRGAIRITSFKNKLDKLSNVI